MNLELEFCFSLMSPSVSDDALIVKVLRFQVEQEPQSTFPLIIGILTRCRGLGFHPKEQLFTSSAILR